MVRITSALIAVFASSLSLVAAQTYQDFTLDDTVAPQFADTATGLVLVAGGVADGKAACDERDDCLGVLCGANPVSGGNACVPFAYASGGDLTPGSTGWTSIHFRYAAPSGPACRQTLGDEFTTSTGECECGSELERQNTGFGCILAITPSQLVQRRRIANNRIMPGHAQRAVYERRRSREQTGGNSFI